MKSLRMSVAATAVALAALAAPALTDAASAHGRGHGPGHHQHHAPRDGRQAAVVNHWGRVVTGDEFNGTKVDETKWGLYGDYVGHAGNGMRLKAQDTEGDGHLRITGKSNGDTGGMAWLKGQKYGRWEARMRVNQQDVGGNKYHPVLLLWPDSEQWPNDGELDYAETDAGTTTVYAFLHYGDGTENGAQDEFQVPHPVDLRQWRNYAIEWTPTHIAGFIDGKKWFDDRSPKAQPPGPMHQTIQLDDFFPENNLNPATMDVDWLRMYKV